MCDVTGSCVAVSGCGWLHWRQPCWNSFEGLHCPGLQAVELKKRSASDALPQLTGSVSTHTRSVCTAVQSLSRPLWPCRAAPPLSVMRHICPAMCLGLRSGWEEGQNGQEQTLDASPGTVCCLQLVVNLQLEVVVARIAAQQRWNGPPECDRSLPPSIAATTRLIRTVGLPAA